ncbi:MAG: PDZ domain-containing protein [Planctomycetes bacterium]|nr:PDZ domain-containing protein [Planctomycetota bacterium]
MRTVINRPSGIVRVLSICLLAACMALHGRAWADAPPKSIPKAFEKEAPESLEDLRAIQGHVRNVLSRVTASTVGVRMGPSFGSGVIINKEGVVLTAGHVSGTAGRDVEIILHDGTRLKGKTLGVDKDRDSGLIQITESGAWTYADMGKSAGMKRGQWCVAIGHPGGFRPGRTPVVRLGRLLNSDKYLQTDCAIVGGDSGGPLFDMDGKVIGIHSRISEPLTVNLHVPIDTYRDTWEKLVKGEVWGGPKAVAYMGIQLDPDAKNCRVAEVSPGSPADKAALKVDDVLLAFDGKKVASINELGTLLRGKRPGNEVVLQVRRGAETLMLRLVLGKRPV